MEIDNVSLRAVARGTGVNTGFGACIGTRVIYDYVLYRRTRVNKARAFSKSTIQ